MTYAIIETGGKQLRVEPGRFYDVDRLPLEPDTQLSLDKVLFVNDGTEVLIGQPVVDGATVEATIMQHLRGRKVLVYKMRPKKKTRKKQGHRAELTRVMINAIHLKGTGKGSPKAEATSVQAEAPAATEIEDVTTVEAEVVV
jgi:large subunit ribosomal protein L21